MASDARPGVERRPGIGRHVGGDPGMQHVGDRTGHGLRGAGFEAQRNLRALDGVGQQLLKLHSTPA